MSNKVVKRNEAEIVTKSGVRDLNGNIIVPIEYDFLTKVNDNLFVATKGSVNGLRIKEGREYSLKRLGRPSLVGEGFSYHFGNRTLDTEVEFYTKQGKLYYGSKILAAIPCKNDDMFLLLDENYKWSMVLVDYQNQIILAGAYVAVDSIEMDYDNNRFIIGINDKFVVASFKEDCRIANVTTLLDGEPVEFHDKGTVLKKNEKYGFVNYNGKVILSCIYGEVIPRKDTIQTITNGGVEIFDYTGKLLVGGENYVWWQARNWGDIEFYVLGHKDGTFCLWTSKKQLLPCEYTSIETCEGFAMVCKDEKYGLLRYDKESDEMKAIFPENFPDEGYEKMRFDFKKDETNVIAERYIFPRKNVYTYNLVAFKE